jgi:hypothetical protein
MQYVMAMHHQQLVEEEADELAAFFQLDDFYLLDQKMMKRE